MEIGCAGAMVMLKDCDSVAGGVAPSATCTVNWEVPEPLGVPAIAPFVPRLRPAGRVPEAIVNFSGVTPPVTASLLAVRYAVLTARKRGGGEHHADDDVDGHIDGDRSIGDGRGSEHHGLLRGDVARRGVSYGEGRRGRKRAAVRERASRRIGSGVVENCQVTPELVVSFKTVAVKGTTCSASTEIVPVGTSLIEMAPGASAAAVAAGNQKNRRKYGGEGEQ